MIEPARRFPLWIVVGGQSEAGRLGLLGAPAAAHETAETAAKRRCRRRAHGRGDVSGTYNAVESSRTSRVGAILIVA